MFAAETGAVLLSESSRRHSPVVDGQHAIFGALADLPNLCVEIAKNEAMRQKIANNAYELMRGRCDTENSCNLILALDRKGVQKSNRSIAIARRLRNASKGIVAGFIGARLGAMNGLAHVGHQRLTRLMR